MSYEEMWKELKEKLAKAGIDLTNLSKNNSNILESYRLSGKADGMKLILEWMRELENIYDVPTL
jgi:hypothetical protein